MDILDNDKDYLDTNNKDHVFAELAGLTYVGPKDQIRDTLYGQWKLGLADLIGIVKSTERHDFMLVTFNTKIPIKFCVVEGLYKIRSGELTVVFKTDWPAYLELAKAYYGH